MSSLDSSRERLAGLTLDDVLANQKRLFGTPPSQQPKSRTLLDIIKEDESNKKDRRSWKAFKDKLRLKRAGSAWTSSIHIPTSDIPLNFSQLGRRNSLRFQTHSNSNNMSTHYDAYQVDDLDPNDDSDSPATAAKPQFSRRSSTRYGSPTDSGDDSDNASGGGNLRPQLSRRNSTNVPSQSEPYRRGRVVTFRDGFEDDDSDEGMRHGAVRTLSAREAVAAQEASEAAAAELEAAERPMMMSLMDLLEVSDKEMGLEGSRYILSDDEDFDDEDDEEEEEGGGGGEGDMENTCCVCMVKHKSAAFTPCGHTFCRMCSRELMVSRGNCPLCNNFILEILEIF